MSENFNLPELMQTLTIGGSSEWDIYFVGDDQVTKLAEFIQELKNDFSEEGNGKQILPGFAYYGTVSSMLWAKTCRDPFYPLMKRSLLSFRRQWNQLFNANMTNKRFHYVSLGVGTGEKDRHVLDSLLNLNPSLIYVPVDISLCTLSTTIQEVTKLNRPVQILPMQIDFSSQEGILRLNSLIRKVVSDQPTLFSLTGNTLANFQNDLELLKLISTLTYSNDLLLLEVASAASTNELALKFATTEYSKIASFRQFLTSSLSQNTNLKIDPDSLIFQAYEEE